jgi:hypothetical protein
MFERLAGEFGCLNAVQPRLFRLIRVPCRIHADLPPVREKIQQREMQNIRSYNWLAAIILQALMHFGLTS